MKLVTELMMECTDVLPRRETVCIEKMCCVDGSVCRVDGGVVVVVRSAAVIGNGRYH